MIFWTVRYTNTQIQIHKYTNTACDEVPEIPNMCYIFEKPRVQGHQTWYSGLSNTQIQMHKCTNTNSQKHKYTNTAYDKMTHMLTYAIFLNSWWFKDVKNDNPKYSYPRYTVDFCTVPPGLLCLWSIFFEAKKTYLKFPSSSTVPMPVEPWNWFGKLQI